MKLSYRVERWAYRTPFVISQWAMDALDVIVVEVEDDGLVGRGECAPTLHIGENLQQTKDRLDAFCAGKEPLTRDRLQQMMRACTARNGIDCALWDLEAKRLGRPAHELAGLTHQPPIQTAFTVSLGAPEAMGAAAEAVSDLPVIKIKLGDAVSDLERVEAVRRAAPRARLVADANGAWSFADLKTLAPQLLDLGVELIEQPLRVGEDVILNGSWKSPVPLCADESVTDRQSLARLAEAYRYVNIKLDKTGGLTGALELMEAARQRGLGIFVGNMGGTSLAMAPAMIVATAADYVDLDGPLLFREDRQPSLWSGGAVLEPPSPELWG